VANYAEVLRSAAEHAELVLLKRWGNAAAILLKRGLSSTVKELLMSRNIVAHGNPDVICASRFVRSKGDAQYLRHYGDSRVE